jgi:cytochrome bd ubiquinol oxidase subunit I
MLIRGSSFVTCAAVHEVVMQKATLRSNVVRWLPIGGMFSLVVVGVLLGGAAFAADPYGGDVQYRELFTEDSTLGFLNSRVIVWILAQLHLLFAAFVLAVPMMVLLLEYLGHKSKDAKAAKQYDDVAHEFARLMTTAFSITSILGAILTFCLMGFYPQLMGYLVEVFGPTMYLYATMFFGESFSLYLYYYGWGKISRKWHLFLGVMLNVFGVSLMLVANAWTTFMMAPAGVEANGAVVDRTAAFFNFLLHPINIHRLIANVCMGGSVAGAYAAYKWLSAKTDEERAHYDWMGYMGNFIAILALLVLPFAGYYLGYEIYMFNQQLGIYMMGGILSWLFVMQAVLIGGLFLGANYYLWLGMDRIEGAERYSGWIKWLLAVITVCVLVWATPKSLQVYMTSAEVTAIGGTNHPIFGLLGVMSAKNTAVNLMILTTFLSFILYRRGNLEATVPWAKTGKMVQAALFGIGAGIVIFIGVGGYIPELWLESTKRVAMSPYQVLTVLVVMVLVMTIDVKLFKGAKEVGRIRWGEVSRRSQYTLIFLAVSFTWLMALMGFVRSSLRQHWHVYEVLEDTSLTAYTPAIGYATIVVSVCVLLFFALVGMVVWIAELGNHDHDDHDGDSTAVAAK